MLLHRIRKLEAAIAARAEPSAVSTGEKVDYCETLGRIRSKFWTSDYDRRGSALSLEQRLALARDDERYAREHPEPIHVTSLEVEVGEGAARFAGIAARELEIRILERDGLLDAGAARSLRENAQAYFMHSVVAGKVVQPPSSEPRVELSPLPNPVDFDEPAVLDAARESVPRRSVLPAARRLAIEEVEHAESLAACPSASLAALYQRMHQLRVAELNGILADEAKSLA